MTDPKFSEHTVLVYDDHFGGGVLADLNGDLYPELVLPGERNLQFVLDQQSEGGLLVYENISGASGREFAFPPIELLRPGTTGDGTEAQGVVAGDFDNDGDLDLFMVCSGEPGLPTDMNAPPADPMQCRLLRNDGSLAFTDVTSTTDPDAGDDLDGHGLAFSQAPLSLIAQDDPGTGQTAFDYYIPDWAGTDTLYTYSSGVAACADVNRDGLFDVYVGTHQWKVLDPQTGGHDDWLINGQMDALYLNLAEDASGNLMFWDLSYDRAPGPRAIRDRTIPQASKRGLLILPLHRGDSC